jgi:hypothetical protein
MLTTVDDDKKPRRASSRGGPFLYLFLCWPLLARAPSGSVGEAGASVGLSCAHGPAPLYSPLVPVLSSYPCSRFTSVEGGPRADGSRAGRRTARCKRRGRYDAGRSATGWPMRRLRPTLTSFLRTGALLGPFWCSRFATRRPPTTPLPSACLHRCSFRHRMAVHPAWSWKGGGRRRALPVLYDSVARRSGLPVGPGCR